MNPCGLTWALYGPIWAHVSPYGLTWASHRPRCTQYGVIWSLMGPLGPKGPCTNPPFANPPCDSTRPFLLERLRPKEVNVFSYLRCLARDCGFHSFGNFAGFFRTVSFPSFRSLWILLFLGCHCCYNRQTVDRALSGEGRFLQPTCKQARCMEILESIADPEQGKGRQQGK